MKNTFGSLLTFVVLANNTPSSIKALETVVELCHCLKQEYIIYVIHVIALNPKRTIPYLDHLEQAYNLEIMEEEKKVSDVIKEHLVKLYHGNTNYKYIQIQGEGEVGELVEKYVMNDLQNANFLYVGSRNNDVVARWALGSVSDYLVHHLKIPVCVVKV